jgi:hypothetical protein
MALLPRLDDYPYWRTPEMDSFYRNHHAQHSFERAVVEAAPGDNLVQDIIALGIEPSPQTVALCDSLVEWTSASFPGHGDYVSLPAACLTPVTVSQCLETALEAIAAFATQDLLGKAYENRTPTLHRERDHVRFNP